MREPGVPTVFLLVALAAGAPVRSVAGPAPDSTTAPRADSVAVTSAIDSLAALDLEIAFEAGGTAALDSTLAWAEAAGARLDASSRRILQELVAGAREMNDEGDLEGAQILAADALLLLRQRLR